MAKRSIFEEVDSDTPKQAAKNGFDRRRKAGCAGADPALAADPVRHGRGDDPDRWVDPVDRLRAFDHRMGAVFRCHPAAERRRLAGAVCRLPDHRRVPPAKQRDDAGTVQDDLLGEWGHRQLGRLIGLVWVVGFLGFLVTKRIPRGWTGRLLGLGVLGGAQGAVGWWMVSSGLGAGVVDVASYRLAVHLGLAFVILGLITWYVLRLARSAHETMTARRNGDTGLSRLVSILVALTFVQILLGALVAGIDAGRNYTDWPLMAGGILPPDPLSLEPIWRNFFENDGLVQFMHRIAGYLVVAVGILAMLRGRRSAIGTTRGAFIAMGAMLVLQLALGVMTVLYSAPLTLAILHQLGAVALWVLILRARFHARYPYPQSLRGPV